MSASEQLPSDLRVLVDGELKPSDIDAPRLVLVRKLNYRGEPIGDFAYAAYWATDGDPAEQDRNAELLATAVNSYDALTECAEALRRSLNWLSSYKGGGAMGAYDQARKALDKLEAVCQSK